MANLTPFDPLRAMTRSFPRSMEEFLRDFRPGLALREFEDMPSIRCDVSENDQAYTVRAEIPGARKEDIKVDVNGNRVTISVETQQASEQKEGDRTIRSEIYRGQMYRSFTLDQEVDDTKVEAKYSDGILNMTLPKKEARPAQKIEIH